MAINLVQGYGYVDDGLVGFKPKVCGVTTGEVESKIQEILQGLKISDDEVSFDGATMKDDYVKSGKYSEDGTITLEIGDDKTAEIKDLPKPMATDDVEDILNK